MRIKILIGVFVSFIERAYPESYGSSIDMRSDERIRKALDRSEEARGTPFLTSP
ncbi:MAG TPA: hypothetical protein VK747_13060 [Blastocatellia bacterium]|nr:hypothetical protein [Blastocatellia bacterium]